jgi:hypothetical protein
MFWESGLFSWTTGIILGVGFAVASLVFLSLQRYITRRQRLLASTAGACPLDAPPPDLLAMLTHRLHGRGGPSGLTSTDRDRRLEALGLPSNGEDEAGHLRWGNPMEVHLTSSLMSSPLHGLVFAQAATYLGVLLDQAISTGTLLRIHSVEAPESVPWVEVEIKSCKKVSKNNHIIACQFVSEVPWNVRVWFG